MDVKDRGWATYERAINILVLMTILNLIVVCTLMFTLNSILISVPAFAFYFLAALTLIVLVVVTFTALRNRISWRGGIVVALCSLVSVSSLILMIAAAQLGPETLVELKTRNAVFRYSFLRNYVPTELAGTLLLTECDATGLFCKTICPTRQTMAYPDGEGITILVTEGSVSVIEDDSGSVILACRRQ
jgi:hypothetical protein